eukprot:CAMPEP_0113622532 /NCGR_PEP_ID=MMETSP0017_2-20120614/11549_1 /TAXON_ID=2856 /ORGANISM="Cylindrotheca closterium" /LENGTH=49 /DNA_ID=CAMNT_0000532371 /DNA_START=67 /DNA_END=212 /DNA_ORIENTATION=- /assembly_acc=CAM_ASM_000147
MKSTALCSLLLLTISTGVSGFVTRLTTYTTTSSPSSNLIVLRDFPEGAG